MTKLTTLSKIIIITLITGRFALWIIPATAEQRGYFAIGGEWILIILVALACHHIIQWIEKEYAYANRFSKIRR